MGASSRHCHCGQYPLPRARAKQQCLWSPFFLTQGSGSDLVSWEIRKENAQKRGWTTWWMSVLWEVSPSSGMGLPPWPGTLVPAGLTGLQQLHTRPLLRKAAKKAMGSGLDNLGNAYYHIKRGLLFSQSSARDDEQLTELLRWLQCPATSN